MAPENLRIILLIAATVPMISSSSAFGQEPLPVFLAFDFGSVGPLKNSPTAAETELKIAESVIKCFKITDHQEHFPWNFRVGKADDFPKIKLILIEDPHWTKWELRIEAYKENGALADMVLPLQRIVSQPGDLELRWGKRRTPRSEEFPGRVAEWIKSRFLQPDLRPDLQRLIMAVAPLGDCIVLARKGIPKCVDDAEGVLQLDLDKVKNLYRSTFTVVCEGQDKSQVELSSEGGETPAEYELSGRKKLGLALKHKKWNDKEIFDYLPRLVQLSKGRVYIEKFRTTRGLPYFSRMQVTDQ